MNFKYSTIVQVGHNYDNVNMLAEAFNSHMGHFMTSVNNKSLTEGNSEAYKSRKCC